MADASPDERFTIVRGAWYAWTMYPGYADEPHSSPIFIHAVSAAGDRCLQIDFLNAGYAEGVQHFTKVLRTLSADHHSYAAKRRTT